MIDAERLLTTALRPLVLGIGGGGDVVGALATAEACRLYHGADPLLGGVTWERRTVDPAPGPRAEEEIEGARRLAPGILQATADTKVRASGVRFAEARMAELLGEETVLVDVTLSPSEIAAGLRAATKRRQCDLVVMVDVGGDALCHGGEDGLASPLCDAVMLAAGWHLERRDSPPVLGAIFGLGCDGELTPKEILERVAEVGAAGGLAGMRGLTPAVAERLDAAVAAIPTEASAQALRCFRGELGPTTIRRGRRTVHLSPIGAMTIYFGVGAALRSAARLARAVRDVDGLESANDVLQRLGITTELDLERAATDR